MAIFCRATFPEKHDVPYINFEKPKCGDHSLIVTNRKTMSLLLNIKNKSKLKMKTKRYEEEEEKEMMGRGKQTKQQQAKK